VFWQSKPTLTVTHPNDFFGFPKVPIFSNAIFVCFLSYILCLRPFFDVSDFEQLRILMHAMTKWHRGVVGTEKITE